MIRSIDRGGSSNSLSLIVQYRAHRADRMELARPWQAVPLDPARSMTSWKGRRAPRPHIQLVEARATYESRYILTERHDINRINQWYCYHGRTDSWTYQLLQ